MGWSLVECGGGRGGGAPTIIITASWIGRVPACTSNSATASKLPESDMSSEQMGCSGRARGE
eukprot:5893530-Prymnesium_polylepis.1